MGVGIIYQRLMIIDTRKDWQKAKCARPHSIPEEDALRKPPTFRMALDAWGILFVVVRTPYKEYTFRYRPQKQDWPEELLDDWFRPGRWKKPTKRQLELLARRARHHMKARKTVLECSRWEDTYPIAKHKERMRMLADAQETGL